jgi:hypothetical protein
MRFGGTWMDVPYVLYDDVEAGKHMDFVTIPGMGQVMMGGYLNNIS